MVEWVVCVSRMRMLRNYCRIILMVEMDLLIMAMGTKWMTWMGAIVDIPFE